MPAFTQGLSGQKRKVRLDQGEDLLKVTQVVLTDLEPESRTPAQGSGLHPHLMVFRGSSHLESNKTG